MRASALVAVVVAVHAVAISTVLFMQGCETPKAPMVMEPPPAPVMPPRPQDPATPSPMVSQRPVFHPPVPVEPAPSMAVPSEGRTYTVQLGDSLSKIASRVGVSVRELAELNNIRDANKIRAGQRLVLPDHAKAISSPAPAAAPKAARARAAAKPSSAGGMTYVVQSGDSLSKIGSKYGVSVSALKDANGLKSDKILIGQKLTIPSGSKSAAPQAPQPASLEPTPRPVEPPAPPAPAEPPAPEHPPVIRQTEPAPGSPVVPSASEQPLDYTVQEGDTLDSIAKLFIVSRDELRNINNIPEGENVRPGQKLKIPSSSM